MKTIHRGREIEINEIATGAFRIMIDGFLYPPGFFDYRCGTMEAALEAAKRWIDVHPLVTA
jgi:hypothetical protein